MLQAVIVAYVLCSYLSEVVEVGSPQAESRFMNVFSYVMTGCVVPLIVSILYPFIVHVLTDGRVPA